MKKIIILSGLFFLPVVTAQAMELPKENVWLEVHEALSIKPGLSAL